MIPIIVIGANDYAEYTNSEKIWVLLRNELPYVDSNGSTQSREEDRAQNAEITQLRDKVLELFLS